MTADEALNGLVETLQRLQRILPADKVTWDSNELVRLASERPWITAGMRPRNTAEQPAWMPEWSRGQSCPVTETGLLTPFQETSRQTGSGPTQQRTSPASSSSAGRPPLTRVHMNLRQVVQMHFMMSGKPFDDSRSFQYHFPDALWDRLSAYLINLKRLPLWVNRNLSTTVFGGKQTREFWRTIFLDGTAPQGQQVLASRRYVLGADDGIRTRDPHLGKAAKAVHLVLIRPVNWSFVRAVVRSDRPHPACSRAVYYERSH